ncbi:MAG TPA: extracellular solute-binding protein, partial [Bacillota bacterium]|nr:extracellular solute-binding protein [Bacillota bacterium]
MHTPSTVTRRTIVLGLGAAAALPLASCVGEGGAPTTAPKGAATGPVEGRVEFWTINLRKNFQMYFEDLISTFESENDGVTVEWVDVPGKDMTAKYLSAIASGKVPDVINVDSKNLGQLNATLAGLDDVYSDDDLSIFQPGLVDGLRVDNTLKGIPWYNSGTRICMYRKSTMDKIG